jgi:acylphosphatase
MIARRVYFEGKVQGVGFRATVKRIAKGFDVAGWVCNLPDGRVELFCQGEEEELEPFLDDISESELKSHIKRTEVHGVVPDPLVLGFRISA